MIQAEISKKNKSRCEFDCFGNGKEKWNHETPHYRISILVQRVKENEKSKGGIIIPDTAKEKPIEGTVIATGNGKLSEAGKRIALDVKKGDRILFGKYSGTEVKIEGEEYLSCARMTSWRPE